MGLSDVSTEGTFVWSDGTSFDFEHWAKNQPNDFHDEDCVHTLGFLKGHEYEWNDVNCTDCHRFTCKKGMRFDFVRKGTEITHIVTYGILSYFGQGKKKPFTM